MIKDTVAENFISGPIGAKGSNGIRPIVPIVQQSKPALTPKIKKQQIHIIEIGSKYAIPQPGTLGNIGAVKAPTTMERAPKISLSGR